MGLLSIFKRAESPSGTGAASEPADAVQRARTRARQRLIGAAVLVIIGIVGFPLVFETQPRPIPVDIPIEVPRREGAPPLVMPPARPSAASSVSQAASAAAQPAAPNDVITESRDDAGRELPPPVVADAAVAPAAPAAPPSKPVAKPVVPSVTADAARARALLEGKTTATASNSAAPAAAEAGRFIVQVGAFADSSAARETRVKVEKLGLKTYTQVASTSAGNRIRVRVGPFATRDEADKAMAKAKGAGLNAVVLTL